MLLYNKLVSVLETYRSGHNEPDSKSGCPQGHVSSNLTVSAIKKDAALTYFYVNAASFFINEINVEVCILI